MANLIDGLMPEFKRKDTALSPKVREKWVSLSDLSHFLMRSDTLEDLAENATSYIVNILEVDYCRIILMDLYGHFYCKAEYSRTAPFQLNGTLFEPSVAEEVYNRLLDPQSHFRLLLAHEHLTSVERASLGIKETEKSWIIPLKVESHGIGVLILGQQGAHGSHILSEDSYYMVDLISDQLSNAIHRAQMNDQIQSLSIETVIALSKTLETRDLHSASHSKLMASLSEQMAVQFNLSVRETRELCWAALLHDIGKIGVEDGILKKTGPLSDSEWEIMKTHPEIGAQIVKGASGLECIAPLILTHHERYDGKGYPEGLAGAQIPLGGRILAVVDAYSTMIEGRPYQVKRTHAEALQELRENSGRAYDPDVIKIFLSLFNGNTRY
jgi:HD-GYP domain-containing protein (c-di-GMP phosphodiesterase class II)